MSYCRFTSSSDIYCYEASGGIALHVASRRTTKDIPFPNLFEYRDNPEKITTLYHKYLDDLDAIPIEDIGLPYDGTSWHGLTTEQALNALLMLKKLGYRVRRYAIECLVDELHSSEAVMYSLH